MYLNEPCSSLKPFLELAYLSFLFYFVEYYSCVSTRFLHTLSCFLENLLFNFQRPIFPVARAPLAAARSLRPSYYTASQSICQVLFQNFFKKFLAVLDASLACLNSISHLLLFVKPFLKLFSAFLRFLFSVSCARVRVYTISGRKSAKSGDWSKILLSNLLKNQKICAIITTYVL